MKAVPSSEIARRNNRKTLFGCDIDALTMEETLEVVEGFVASGEPHQHVVVNINKLIKARRDAAFRMLINECDLVNCDGMPVVWASRLLGKTLPERVAGIDLFEKLIAKSAEEGWRVYLLGAREEVVRRVKEVFCARHPRLHVVGCRNGYWTDEEECAVVDAIRDSAPDILFVAIPSPAKERFLQRYLDTMRVPFAMGVGGSFDVVAGYTTRAPRWMQRSGLEWFYRFLQEPRRLFGRYFIEGALFLELLTRELVSTLWRRTAMRSNDSA